MDRAIDVDTNISPELTQGLLKTLCSTHGEKEGD